MQQFGDVTVTCDEALVATVEIRRPPNNYFDVELIDRLAEAYEALDADPGCRAIMLCSEGKHFCAGANFSPSQGNHEEATDGHAAAVLYEHAVRLIAAHTPVVAAVQGAAIGGGLGLACSADFRVASREARFSANFARLGLHHGFGLSVTLPGIVGQQRALDLLLTGRRVQGEEALRMGLCDALVAARELRSAAHGLAAEIAASAPLAVRSIRETMREGLAERFRVATEREAAEQDRLRMTTDWLEGVRAVADRTTPRFEGR